MPPNLAHSSCSATSQVSPCI